MIFLNGAFVSDTLVVGPWTTDQELQKMAAASNRPDTTLQTLAELRTTCRESLARENAIYRPPCTGAQ